MPAPHPVYAHYHCGKEHYYTRNGWLHNENGPAYEEKWHDIKIWAIDGVITQQQIPDCSPFRFPVVSKGVPTEFRIPSFLMHLTRVGIRPGT